MHFELLQLHLLKSFSIILGTRFTLKYWNFPLMDSDKPKKNFGEYIHFKMYVLIKKRLINIEKCRSINLVNDQLLTWVFSFDRHCHFISFFFPLWPSTSYRSSQTSTLPFHCFSLSLPVFSPPPCVWHSVWLWPLCNWVVLNWKWGKGGREGRGGWKEISLSHDDDDDEVCVCVDRWWDDAIRGGDWCSL